MTFTLQLIKITEQDLRHMETIISSAALQTSYNDNFCVEVEVLNTEIENCVELFRSWAQAEIEDIDNQIAVLGEQKIKNEQQIDRFTNHSDKVDYTVAAASGLLCGLIDSFFVGEFSFDNGMDFANAKLEGKIIHLAKKAGWEGVKKGEHKGEFTLKGAIEYLEEHYKMPSDPLKDVFGGSRQHHLRDFAHHHSIIGLFFSILTQFTGKAYGTDTNGTFITVDVPKEMIGKDFKRKWAIGVTDWALHLASDMHGSSSTPGVGCGIPGPLVSLLKAISALPIFKGEKPGDNKLSLLAAKLYNGTLFADRDENGKLIPVKIDLRGEIAIQHELGKQAAPVIVNEVFIRAFYLIRRLYMEIKEKSITSWADLSKLNWRKIIPVYNRTINRMLLVSTGTFTAVDLTDAAIRGAILSGGSWAKFGKEFIVRVNFVGIGRFAIGLGGEFIMSQKLKRARNERIKVVNQMLYLTSAKLYYKQISMWISAQKAEEAISDLYSRAEKSELFIIESLTEMNDDFEKISSDLKGMDAHNPGLRQKLLTILNE